MDKKTKILESALKLYSEKGSKNTSVEDIAKKAGIGKGTIYLYFKSKEDIFIESVIYAFSQWGKVLKEELEKIDSYEKRLEFYIEKNILMLSKSKEIANIFVAEFPTFLSLIIQRNKVKKSYLYNQRIMFLKSIIENGVKNGEFKEVDSEIFSQILVGAINSFFAKRLLLKEKTQKNEIKRFISMIMQIIIKEDK